MADDAARLKIGDLQGGDPLPPQTCSARFAVVLLRGGGAWIGGPATFWRAVARVGDRDLLACDGDADLALCVLRDRLHR
jgi:hypothetical protein